MPSPNPPATTEPDGEPDLDVDVAIVGAGPAGSAAALAVLAARPGARVALLDRAAFPRDKTCGDGVAPQVLDVLARLGVRGLLDDWPGVDRLELGYPGGAWLQGRVARPNYVVPRAVLDARLVEAAVARGARLLQRRVRTLHADGEAVVAAGVRAPIVVGADGASSVVRAYLAPPGGGHTAIALRGYAPVRAEFDGAQVIAFDPEGAWPAYAWSFPIGDGRANVGYGEILPLDGRPGPTRKHLADRLDTPVARRVRGRDGVARAPPAAVHHPLAAAGRLRPARRGRARPDQPADGGGHPRSRVERRVRRAGGGGRAARRRSGNGGRALPRRTAEPVRPALAAHGPAGRRHPAARARGRRP